MRKFYSLIKGNRLLIYSLWLTFLILESCNDAEEVKPIASAEQWFNKTLGMQWDAWPKKTNIQSIDWSNAIIHGTTIEVPVHLQEKVVGQYYNGKESSKNEFSIRLVIWKENKEYHAILLEILQQSGNPLLHLGEIENSGFSGLMVANLGEGKTYAAVIDKGHAQLKNQESENARVEDLHCIYYVHYTTISMGNYTHTTVHSIFQGCYNDTEPQGLPPDMGGGGGPYFDIPGESGGSGSSDWSPGPPANPQDGDIYESADSDGKTTLSRYNAQLDKWEWLQITLPQVEVTAKPNQYPFLLNIPTDLPIIGPDGNMYRFDISSLSWNITPIAVEPPPVENTITNIIEYLKCFNKNAAAELTIYVDQPTPGTGQSYNKSDVGHAFITITQQVNGDMISRTVGFYPQNWVTPLSPSSSGALVNNSGHEYDVHMTLTIDSNQLTQILNSISASSSTGYNLNTYNCTNFALGTCSAGGISLPQTIGTWPGGEGLNPGNLGQDIMNMTLPTNYVSRSNGGGVSPPKRGNCN